MFIDRHLADQPDHPELELFHIARHAAALAFCQWVNSCRPDAADLALEADGTAAIFHGIADLVGGMPS